MTAVLGCIADDFTGGTDLAETLSRNGMRTIQLLGVPDTALASEAAAQAEEGAAAPAEAPAEGEAPAEA